MKKVAPPPPPPLGVAKPPPPLSNGSVLGRRASSVGEQRPPLSTTPGEDCAFDELLEGRMELEVVLPDLKVVRMTVDRRTPMMDLLVQATTSNKISPAGHIINVISKDERNVNYKPNTPIGSLDVSTVYIIPKSTLELQVKRMPKLANQPFEQTFRLQVNLPQNQRMVLRVSPRITLAELKLQICSEKELDHSSHHLVHPAQPDTILDLNATLDVYGWSEINLMSNTGLRDSIRNTSTNIFPVQRSEEERILRKEKRGILRLFSRKKRDFTVENTNGSNSIPTSHSENSSLNRNSYQPKQSIKRKPAPAPPPVRNSSPPLITQSSNSINSRPESEISVKTADEIESTVSHSRHSSDSSGYHEPSVFSDCSENKSPEASIVHSDCVSVSDATRQNSPLHKDYPDSSVQLKRSSMTAKETNLKNVPSCSNVSIISASRKRKAPQPPVSTLPAIESPSSPDPPSSDPASVYPPSGVPICDGIENGAETLDSRQIATVEANSMTHVSDNDVESQDSVQQESEALQYLEDVLLESENSSRNFTSQRILDDSDTDSLKDEGEVVSVCQAEVHAHPNDQDSSDSVVEPPTVVTPDPTLPKSSFAPDPNSHPDGCEVVDTSADDSGISHSLTSDADSSVPSINSDFKTLSDSGCQEEIYCNVTDSLDVKSVPSSDEFPVHDPVHFINDKIEENPTNGVSSEDALNNIGDKSVDPIATTNEMYSLCAIQDLNDTPAVSQNQAMWDLPTKSEAPVLETDPIRLYTETCDESKCDNNSDKYSATSSLSIDSVSHTPQTHKKLDNFALGCYRKDEDIDIYSTQSPEHSSANSSTNQSSLKNEIEVPLRKHRKQPDVKITSFKEQSEKEGNLSFENKKGRVLEKCAQLSGMSALPLTGRSSSLFNLTPQKKMQRFVTEMDNTEEEPLNGSMKRTHSDQNVAKELEPVQLKETFLQEQKRLQEEYRRLQEQFISWQKQLLCNQSLLQNEKIVPQMPFPSLEGLTSLDTDAIIYNNPVMQKSDTSLSYNDLKTRSLPRPKTKPLSLREPSRPPTPPLSQSPTETSVVDIDISSKEPLESSQETIKNLEEPENSLPETLKKSSETVKGKEASSSNFQDPAKRPDSLNSRSVNTQATSNQEDKVTQIPSPQDKVTQVPSPQEKVTSGTQVPSPENVLNKDTSAQTSDNIQVSSTDVSSNSLSSPESENSKSQTLPRPKPKPISAFQPSRTMTLNRNTRPKSQVVSVTIGSWQQRQMPAADIEPSNSVASTRSKFLSLENIPQSTTKSVVGTMEKRKLPPVPIESSEVVTKTVPKTSEIAATIPKSVEAKMTAVKTEHVSHTANSKPDEGKSEHIYAKSSKTHNFGETKVMKTIPKQIDDTAPKQKSEIKLASREPAATFKLAKPFIKLSSMKDEPHTPSIIGLKKWPLSEISESHSSTEGKQAILEDLRASSRKPGGYVQDKIRRAEVDLRKPKASKVEFANPPKSKPEAEETKLHITKVSVNNTKSSTDSNKPPPKTSSGHNATVTANITYKSNTMPKSQSLNSELMSVFSRKASKDTEKSNQNDTAIKKFAQTVTVNGSAQAVPPPPPPPPPPPAEPQPSSSAMPTIPPAEQIPVSSQLLMARGTKTLPARKETKKSPSKLTRTSDPREELMLEIRGFGGKQALRKAPSMQAGWHLKVFGTASTANT